MLLLMLAVFLLFVIIYVKLYKDIYNDKSPFKAHPSSLYPSIFFDEVFSLCESKDLNQIEKLQVEIEALQLTHAPENPQKNVCSISGAARQITQKYEKCLQKYLTEFPHPAGKKPAITRLKNKIELGHKIIEKEKDAFLSDNGENAVSFIFNRQNQLTDILLTGIAIPILLEILKWDAKNIKDFMSTLEESSVMCFIVGIFIILFLYRILKYTKNKRSMLRGMKQTVLYDKAELMLCAFECALKNVDMQNCTEM